MDVKQSGKENMEDLPEADLVLNAHEKPGKMCKMYLDKKYKVL